MKNSENTGSSVAYEEHWDHSAIFNYFRNRHDYDVDEVKAQVYGNFFLFRPGDFPRISGNL